MYIEVFLIDNLLMDYLIVRLASVLLACPAPAARQLTAAALASALSAAVLMFLPGATVPRLAVGLALVPALPHSSWRSLATSTLALYVAAFAVGGAAFAAAYATGGGLRGGVLFLGLPVRLALCSVTAAVLMPPALKRLIRRRAVGRVEVKLLHDDVDYSFEGAVDPCNLLTDPFSGLPVIVVYCPALQEAVTRCLGVRTVGGDGSLCGFVPAGLRIRSGDEWRSVSACVALAQHRMSVGTALVPAVLIRED